jgi:hypothetical protein
MPGLGGAWRSLVAHLLWEQGVGGSNPLAPTAKLARSLREPCGCSSTVEPQPSKLVMGVRFPSPALAQQFSKYPPELVIALWIWLGRPPPRWRAGAQLPRPSIPRLLLLAEHQPALFEVCSGPRASPRTLFPAGTSARATVSPVPRVQAVPAVTEAVVRSLTGPGDESVEGDGYVENGCGHGISFPGLRSSSDLPASTGRLIPRSYRASRRLQTPAGR